MSRISPVGLEKRRSKDPWAHEADQAIFIMA